MQPVRIGVIGVGHRGRYYADEFHHRVPGSVVIAAADPREAHLTRMRDTLGPDIFLTSDYRELLSRSDVDAVAVASPDSLHEEHGLATLGAGKHLLLEKPMATTVDACDRMLVAHEKAGVVFGFGLSMRYMPVFEVMKNIVDSGDIGDVKAYWCNHYVGQGGVFFFHDWHSTRENVTGLLLQKGTHDIDMMHFQTGRFTTRVAAFGGRDLYGGDKPNDLHCPDCEIRDTCPDLQLESLPRYQQLCAFRREIDIPDNHVVIMQLEGGIKAAYQECHFTPDYHRDHCVIGTKGRVYNSEDYKLVTVRIRRRHGLADIVHHIHPPEGGHMGGDTRLCRDFISAIQEKRPMRSDPFSARMAVAVGVAAHRSIDAGGQVFPVTAPACTS